MDLDGKIVFAACLSSFLLSTLLAARVLEKIDRMNSREKTETENPYSDASSNKDHTDMDTKSLDDSPGTQRFHRTNPPKKQFPHLQM